MEKGGGKGNWSAYKAAEMAKVYEAKGGGYEDSGDNPNEASKVSCASERASESDSTTVAASRLPGKTAGLAMHLLTLCFSSR